MLQAHEFPVDLQPLYTRGGLEAPRVRGVVRTDTGGPIATVSTRYRLLEHKQVVDAAEAFITQLGTPTRNFALAKNGAVLVGEYTYADKTLAVKTGEVVGMRVYIHNAYNGSSCLKFRVGALVLKCLNGMLVSKDIFNVSYRHQGEQEIKFPDPAMVYASFVTATKQWGEYSSDLLTLNSYSEYLYKASQAKLIPEKVAKALPAGESVWDLYNQITYHITHETKATKIGVINKLSRTAEWFENTFTH